MPSPTVSVIVPVFNSAAYLERALDSLAAQTFQDFEVICIDDGSDDNSFEVLKRYRDSGSFSSFSILTQRHLGPGRARNKGLEEAQGTYVLFMDSDDFIEPELLEHAVARAEDLSCDIVVWDVWYFNNRVQRDQHPAVGTLEFLAFVSPEEQGEKAFCASDNPDAIFTSFQNWPWNKLFRRSFIEEHGLRFPSLFRTEDLPFTCEALVLAKRIGVIYERLSHYRMRTGQSSMDTKDRHAQDFIEAFAQLKGDLQARGLYETYRTSYVRWALGGAVYNLNSLTTARAFSEAFEALHRGGIDRMGLRDVPLETYANELDRQSLRLIESGNSLAYLFFWMRNHCEFVDDHKEAIDMLEADLDAARDDAHRTREQLNRKIAELEAAHAELDASEEELDRLQRSAEFRYGTALLRIPRAIQRRLRG